MLFIGTKNITSQTVLTDGLITIGDVYRKYCRPTSTGLKTFDNTSTGIVLQGQGMYHLTATFIGTGTEEGEITIQMLENGTPTTGALSTETITTPETEFRTLVIDYIILVDATCILGCNSTIAKTISFENTGVGATFTNVVVNVEKVV